MPPSTSHAPMRSRRTCAACLEDGVPVVVGTSGFDQERIDALAREHALPVFYAPNFALGAVLMMRFAEEAGKLLPNAEIVELHHETKLDAPSGTAKATAERLPGETPIHSVRLPGLVAHQEVIFGGPGQTLTIRHDTTSREAFVPGVLLALEQAARPAAGPDRRSRRAALARGPAHARPSPADRRSGRWRLRPSRTRRPRRVTLLRRGTFVKIGRDRVRGRRPDRAAGGRDCQCGKHVAARRRRRGRGDPSRRRPGDPGRVPSPRRLRHGRCEGDDGRTAAGPLGDPCRRPGVAGRRCRRARAAGIRAQAVARGRARPGGEHRRVPGHLMRDLRLSAGACGAGGDRRGSPVRDQSLDTIRFVFLQDELRAVFERAAAL